MAVLGHSGSQAPQLMHSLVMTVAMGGGNTTGPREGPTRPSRAATDPQVGRNAMMRPLGIVAGLLLAVAIAGAEEDPELRAAQRELKQARAHLQEADRDYQGHRRKAVEYVDQALSELRTALEVDKEN